VFLLLFLKLYDCYFVVANMTLRCKDCIAGKDYAEFYHDFYAAPCIHVHAYGIIGFQTGRTLQYMYYIVA